MTHNRTLLALSAAMFVGAALAATHAWETSAATANVTIADNSFTDAMSTTTTTTITAGDTVMWTWSGAAQHSVTADDSAFDDPAGSAKTSGTFSRIFSTPGTFAYYCRVHGAPGGNGMSGTVIVQPAAATNTPTSTLAATTNTPAPTDTPATSTNTPAATESPTATNTPATPTAPTPASTAPAGATPSAAAAGAGTRLPQTGAGISGRHSARRWPSLLLVALGLVAYATGVAMRRRTPV